jgi:hypothetical protein
MDPATHQLLQVGVHDNENKPTAEIIEDLMGKKPELRFRFVQENARLVEELDVWGASQSRARAKPQSARALRHLPKSGTLWAGRAFHED